MGLTQPQFAEVVGINKGTLNAIECLRFDSVSLNAINVVADFIGVPPEQVAPEGVRGTRLASTFERAAEIEAPALLAAADRTAARLVADPVAGAERAEGQPLGEVLDGLLRTLTFREHQVVSLRQGLGDGHVYSLTEVGRIVGVTRERVRQIEARAIRKLQHPERARKLEPFLEGDL
jgi:RNA polymerase sigma factor (sigma-70 family)